MAVTVVFCNFRGFLFVIGDTDSCKREIAQEYVYHMFDMFDISMH